MQNLRCCCCRRLPRHPHVVSVLDVYEDRKSLFILMELCDRNSLVDRVVADGAFSEEHAKIIFAQVRIRSCFLLCLFISLIPTALAYFFIFSRDS